MRIAFVYDAVYPWVKGGVEKRVYEIAKRLTGKGHEVHWFGLKWWEGDDVIERDGIIIHGIGRKCNLYTHSGRRSIWEALYFGSKLLIKLNESFDIIDCQEFPYISCINTKLKSMINKSKYIVTWHEIWGAYWFDYLGIVGVFGWIMEMLLAKIPHMAIAVSNNVKSRLKALGVQEVRVIPNGVDLYKIYKAKRFSTLNCDVIYVGRLAKHKNVDVLLKAIAEIKKYVSDIKCCIVGAGPDYKYLKALSMQLNIENNVSFLGSIKNDEEVYSILRSSKVFVLPSTREGFSIAVLEAMACGLPVIVVKHEMNAATEIVEDDFNGYVVHLSPHQIAYRIVYMLQNPDVLKRLGTNAIEFAEKHDWNIIADQIEEVYNEVVNL